MIPGSRIYSRFCLVNDLTYFPEKVLIDQDCLGLPLTARVQSRCRHVPQHIISDAQERAEVLNAFSDPLSEGKKILWVTRKRGGFVKPCPCTPGYIGCGYFIINTDLNCPLDCSYCVLQGYLSQPFITVHANTEGLWKELDRFLEGRGSRRIRIGTGELGDSLALDHITKRSADLIAYFRTKRHVLFELKTKTLNIQNVLAVEPAENVVIAWSLNSERMAQAEERGAPPVRERIEAAHQTARRGYSVAFHFDPLLCYPGWQQDYASVIEHLFQKINPSRIAWISLGSLRFPASLKGTIQKRFPGSRILLEELVSGRDGKLRYLKPLRQKLYRWVVDLIKSKGGKDIRLYFCMESEDVWRKGLKKTPRSEEDVSEGLSSPLGVEEQD